MGELEKYLRIRESEGLTRRYIQSQKSNLLMFVEFCWENGIDQAKNILREHIISFMKTIDGFTVNYQRQVLSFIRQFLHFHGNIEMNRLRIKLRGHSRLRVDWMSHGEVDHIFNTPMNQEEAIILGAGFLMGLRKIEILRLTVRDIKNAIEYGHLLRIKGKGGKERTIPLQPDYFLILSGFLASHEGLEDAARIIPYERTKIERILENFCLRFGKHFTFHTMRRTFGRMRWLEGAKIEVLAKILGHESIDMTRKYLGLDISDMREVMESYRINLNIVTKKKAGER